MLGSELCEFIRLAPRLNMLRMLRGLLASCLQVGFAPILPSRRKSARLPHLPLCVLCHGNIRRDNRKTGCGSLPRSPFRSPWPLLPSSGSMRRGIGGPSIGHARLCRVQRRGKLLPLGSNGNGVKDGCGDGLFFRSFTIAVWPKDPISPACRG